MRFPERIHGASGARAIHLLGYSEAWSPKNGPSTLAHDDSSVGSCVQVCVTLSQHLTADLPLESIGDISQVSVHVVAWQLPVEHS